MTGLRPLADGERTARGELIIPDVFVAGVPHQITAATTYFLLKNMAACGPRVRLHPWDSWEELGERLSARLGLHLWHPRHWDRYYATRPDVPASTPGAVPLSGAQYRALLRAKAERALAERATTDAARTP